MDFVERLTGLSPDNGSGVYEAILVVALLALAGGVVAVIRQRGRRR